MLSKRWYHADIDGHEAQRLLNRDGVSGTFIIRSSASTPTHPTISVKLEDSIAHIKVIRNAADSYSLNADRRFATLASCVQYYMDNPSELKSRTGEHVRLLRPLMRFSPTNERWFHGPLSGDVANEKLLDVKRDGAFLVRDSNSSFGDYVLSVVVNCAVTHIIIYCHDGDRFDIGGGLEFPSLTHLIDHYTKSPMVDKDGVVLQLKWPLYTTRFQTSHISQRVQQLCKDSSGCDGFCQEFEHIQHQEYRHVAAREAGALPENRNKNRFKNILPYDHSRVVLRFLSPHCSHNDYINANYVLPYDQCGPDAIRYIATQGCLPHTVDEFWWMVCVERVSIIVMFTKEMERGRQKCAKYWPDTGQEFHSYGRVGVRTVEERSSISYILRIFEVSVPTLLSMSDDSRQADTEIRRVFQFNYLSCLDHGAPNDVGSFLNFIIDVKYCYTNMITKRDRTNTPKGDTGATSISEAAACSGGNSARFSYVIVHCSAGIGRTGTFIAVDFLLSQIKHQGMDSVIDIQHTVKYLRNFRSSLVQTESQYRFIYTAIMHYIDLVTIRQQAEQKLCDNGTDYTNIENNCSLDLLTSTSPGLFHSSHTSRQPMSPPVPDVSCQSPSQSNMEQIIGSTAQYINFPG